MCSAYSLTLFGWNYFFCADEECTFHVVVVHLVRVMTVLGVAAFLFTSSMLMNVTYGIMTGIGTIDRLKKKATNTMSQSDEEREYIPDESDSTIIILDQFLTSIIPNLLYCFKHFFLKLLC